MYTLNVCSVADVLLSLHLCELGSHPLCVCVCVFQVAAQAVLFMCMNTAGIFISYLSDRAQRQAFLETRRCIEARLRLETENQRQVSLRRDTRWKHKVWCAGGSCCVMACCADLFKSYYIFLLCRQQQHCVFSQELSPCLHWKLEYVKHKISLTTVCYYLAVLKPCWPCSVHTPLAADTVLLHHNQSSVR